MSNLRLKDHTWDAANVYDSSFGKTQAAINADAQHTPYPGPNGNWMIWDAAQGKYVDSGVQSKGNTGATGATGAKGDTGDPAPSSAVVPAVESWLESNISQETGYVVDDSFSTSGAATDSKKTGLALDSLAFSAIDEELDKKRGVLLRGPRFAVKTYNGITATFIGQKVILNGTATSGAVFVVHKDDEVYTVSNLKAVLPYNRTTPVVEGHQLKMQYSFIDGKVSLREEEYTPSNVWPAEGVNAVTAFLMKGDATSDAVSQRIFKLTPNVNSSVIISSKNVGTLILFVYQGCICENAVFDFWVEDATKTESKITEVPEYWKSELNDSVKKINEYSTSQGRLDPTLCVITDCHWKDNKKVSPFLAKELINRANIDYFVNCGDIIKNHNTGTKQDVIAELYDCINAFRDVGLPMITCYGNHDRNRDGRTTGTVLLGKNEHQNIVNKSFFNKLNITPLTSDWDCFYWEDDKYIYAVSYWYMVNYNVATFSEEESGTGNIVYVNVDSWSRELPWVNALFQHSIEQNKKVVMFNHGIYYALYQNTQRDVTHGMWLLKALEPYKERIRCFIQGHVHTDGLRWAYENSANKVPIIILDCDTFRDTKSTAQTDTEQCLSLITIGDSKINVIRVGRGLDFEVTNSTNAFRVLYDSEKNPSIENCYYTDEATVSISKQPSSVSGVAGSVISISLTAMGTGTVKYQWQKKNAAVTYDTWDNVTDETTYSGQNRDTLQINATASLNGSIFRCVVTDTTFIPVISNAATVSVS